MKEDKVEEEEKEEEWMKVEEEERNKDEEEDQLQRPELNCDSVFHRCSVQVYSISYLFKSAEPSVRR